MLNPDTPHRRGTYVHHSYAVRDGDWVLASKKRSPRDGVDLEMHQFELFNLSEDLAQERDLASAHPERVEDLFEAFNRFIANRKMK